MVKPVVAISGANGFIGKYLTKFLYYRGYKVIPIPHELLAIPTELEMIFEEEKPTFIIHLAAYGNMGGQTNFEETCNANILALYNILQASRSTPYLKFVNISSSSVYGKTRNVMSESDKLNPETAYAKTKACGEILAKAFADEYEKPLITIRPFSVYGDGEADFRFIPTVIEKIRNNEPLTLYKGNHDWIYIDDFVRGMTILMESPKTNGIYNIGTGIQTPNREVVKLIGVILNQTPIIADLKPLKGTDSSMWVANIKRAILAGFVPNLTLHEGLVRTIKYYERNIKN